MKSLIIIIFILSHVMTQLPDYCDESLCDGQEHVACGEDVWGSDCGKRKEFIDIAHLKDKILDKHNEYRSATAKGLNNLKPAAKMIKMKWDEELAYVAGSNVKKCVFEHDNCRNTHRFKESGQNLYSAWGSDTLDNDMRLIEGVDNWFDEHKNCLQEDIDSYKVTEETIGHFTVMVNDRNTHVGCAAVKTSERGGEKIYYCCNYAYNNILGQPVYISGETASACPNGVDSTYPALCVEDKSIDPAPFLLDHAKSRSSRCGKTLPLWPSNIIVTLLRHVFTKYLKL